MKEDRIHKGSKHETKREYARNTTKLKMGKSGKEKCHPAPGINKRSSSIGALKK
jgi:hypothetical protein